MFIVVFPAVLFAAATEGWSHGTGRCNLAGGPAAAAIVRPMAAIIIQVKVRPNARGSSLLRQPDGSWAAQVKAPAMEGRANKELISIIAEHFRCPKSAVTIKSGNSGRTKLVRIAATGRGSGAA